jgi:hypothetical protein
MKVGIRDRVYELAAGEVRTFPLPARGDQAPIHPDARPVRAGARPDARG